MICEMRDTNEAKVIHFGVRVQGYRFSRIFIDLEEIDQYILRERVQGEGFKKVEEYLESLHNISDKVVYLDEYSRTVEFPR